MRHSPASTRALGIVIGAVLGAALLLAADRAPRPPRPLGPAAASVTVALPDLVPAGSSATVTAGPFDGRSLQATVLVTSTYATWSTTAPIRRGELSVALPSHLLARAGVVEAVVRTETEEGRATTEVVPLAPEGPLELRVGARSVTADAGHWAMGVVIPEDALGNPIAEGTPVEVLVLHPDGEQELLTSRIDGGLAWLRVWSRTTAGRARLAVSVAGVRGGEADLEEVPGPPTELTLSTDDLPRIADGRDLVAVRTSRLVDAFGNEVADGTAVELAVTGDAGARLLVAPTVNGVAEFVVEAPATPRTLTFVATAYGVASDPMELAFAPDIVGPVTVEAQLAADRVVVGIGPVLGRLGQLAPDGTEVEVTLTVAGAEDRSASGQLRDGRAEVTFPRPANLDGATVTVTVAGVATTAEVTP